MGFVRGPVTVAVPATSANLGPGFDCLGVALELRDRLTAEVLESGPLSVEVHGEGAGEVPTDRSHLVVRAMDAAFALAGVPAPPLRLVCRNAVPHGRGLGSSAAAIVGGIGLARALLEPAQRFDDTAALTLANRLEGHPDNAAPALHGGLVVSGQHRTGDQDPEAWAHRAALDPRISTVVLVPPYGVRTEVARGLLPAVLPYADAVANTGRAALLVAALAGDPALLWRATEDFVHQRYRAPAMPESLALLQALRAAGTPAVVSGAGPSVLAFVAPGLPDAATVAAACPGGWRAEALEISVTGVEVASSG